MDRQESWEQNLEKLIREQALLDLQMGAGSSYGQIRRRKYELAYMMGRTYMEHGRYQEADQQFQQALRIVLTSQFPDGQHLFKKTRDDLTRLYVRIKMQDRDAHPCQQLAQFLEEQKAQELLADFYMAILYLANNEFQRTGNHVFKAIMDEPGRKAIQLWSELKDELRMAMAQSLLGIVADEWEGLSLLEEATATFERLAQTDADPLVRRVAAERSIWVYDTLANRYFNSGLFDEAVEYYRRVQLVREREEDKAGLISSHLSLANTYLQMERLEEAIEEYKDAQGIAIELVDWPSLAQIHKGLGLAYARKQNLLEVRQELELTEDALSHLEEGGGVLSMWISLAKTYEQQRLWEKANACYERARLMATALERRDAVLGVEYRLGHIFLEQHDFPQALAHFQSARLLAEQEGDHGAIAQIDAYLSFLETDTP